MGSSQAIPRIYAKFEGETKPGESQILRHVMTLLNPGDPQTMLEELEYSINSSYRARIKKLPDINFLGTRERLRILHLTYSK